MNVVLTAAWEPLPGANDVTVAPAVLTLTPKPVEQPVVDQGLSANEITIKSKGRVLWLQLHDLENLKNKRIALNIAPAPGDPYGPPLFTLPFVEPTDLLPAMFTGASLEGGKIVFHQPLAAAKLRLTLVEAGFPADQTATAPKIGRVEARTVVYPRNVTVKDEQGVVVWTAPGELLAPVTIDVTLALETVLRAKARSGSPLNAKLTVTGTEGEVQASLGAVRGKVIRRIDGIVTTELDGEPVPLSLPPPQVKPPSRARADVTVRYRGIRLHEGLAGAVPTVAGNIGGVIVTETAVVRTLPAKALDGLVVAKIGVIGRAPVDCELVVQLFDVRSGSAGAALTKPAAQTLAASDSVRTIWFDVPLHEPLAVPPAVVARTNHGRFFWAAAGEPLVRIAVHDDDPGGRPVRLRSSLLAALQNAESHQPARSIPSPAFAVPLFDSALFATVDLSDLTLEYDR
jgi:hypothetical protein